MTTYKTPKGTTITNAAAWTAPLISLKLNDESTVEVEDSTLDDTVTKTKDTGFREAGETVLTIEYQPDNLPTLGGDDQQWTVTLPSSGTESFTGHVSSITAPTLERGGTRMVQEITIKNNSLRSFAA